MVIWAWYARISAYGNVNDWLTGTVCVMRENWIEYCCRFLIRVCGGVEDDKDDAGEQSARSLVWACASARIRSHSLTGKCLTTIWNAFGSSSCLSRIVLLFLSCGFFSAFIRTHIYPARDRTRQMWWHSKLNAKWKRNFFFLSNHFLLRWWLWDNWNGFADAMGSRHCARTIIASESKMGANESIPKNITTTI